MIMTNENGEYIYYGAGYYFKFTTRSIIGMQL